MDFSYEDIPKKSRGNPVKVTKGKKARPTDTPGAAKSPLTSLTRRTAPGESGMARLTRLQQETPGCDVCGSSSVVYRRTLKGKDTYRCGLHIGSTVKVDTQEQRAVNTYYRAKEEGVLDNQVSL